MTTAAKHPPSLLMQEAASLFYLLGGAGSQHLVIVGGMVPPLLVPGAAEAHIGSSDIDLCLSVAFTEGNTRQYYRSIQEQIEPHFEAVDRTGFRWRKRPGVPGLPLVIDFLSPAAEYGHQRIDGTRDLDGEVAEANAGPVLRPYPIRSGALIDRDALTLLVEDVALVYSDDLEMHADVHVRHAGPVGFLAAKADALNGRDDTKDGYDVAWWCIHAAGTPDAVAQIVIDRPAFRDELFQESVALLLSAFKDRRYPGPTGYAAERHPHAAAGDEIFEQARNQALLACQPVLRILADNLFE